MGLDYWRSEAKYSASDILLNNISILIQSVRFFCYQLVRSILSTNYEYNVSLLKLFKRYSIYQTINFKHFIMRALYHFDYDKLFHNWVIK